LRQGASGPDSGNARADDGDSRHAIAMCLLSIAGSILLLPPPMPFVSIKAENGFCTQNAQATFESTLVPF
jgi:hypothetical protein